MALVMDPIRAAGLLLADLCAVGHVRPLGLSARLRPAGAGDHCAGGDASASASAGRPPARCRNGLVAGLIGVIGTAFALNLMLRHAPEGPPQPARVAPGLFWGAIAGFTSFISHSGGPPFQVYVLPLRLPKTVFAGTTTVSFAMINAVKLIPYWALGQFSTAEPRSLGDAGAAGGDLGVHRRAAGADPAAESGSSASSSGRCWRSRSSWCGAPWRRRSDRQAARPPCRTSATCAGVGRRGGAAPAATPPPGIFEKQRSDGRPGCRSASYSAARPVSRSTLAVSAAI